MKPETSEKLDEYVKQLAKAQIFGGIPFPKLRELAAKCAYLQVDPQTIIVEEDALITGLHVLIEGSVEIVKREQASVARLEAGASMGEICMLGQSVAATASLVANIRSILFVVKKSEIEEWFEDDYETQSFFYRNLSAELAQKLVNTTDLLRQVQAEKAKHE